MYIHNMLTELIMKSAKIITKLYKGVNRNDKKAKNI